MNPNGAPEKYKPEMCDWLIDHMAQGYSLESFVGWLYVNHKLKINRTSLYNWKNPEHNSFHQEFLDAYEIAKECCLVFWERQGIDGLYNRTITTTDENGKPKVTQQSAASTGIWALNMRNRFGWRDKIEVSADGNKPLEIKLSYDTEDDPE